MIRLEDLHIGDKVMTNMSKYPAEVIKLESKQYINYKKALHKIDDPNKRVLLKFTNDNKTDICTIYDCVTLWFENDDYLFGTDISNITRIIKDKKENRESFIKRLFKKIF